MEISKITLQEIMNEVHPINTELNFESIQSVLKIDTELLGRLIKNYRVTHNITQLSAAKEVFRCSVQTLFRIERNIKVKKSSLEPVYFKYLSLTGEFRLKETSRLSNRQRVNN